MRERDSSWASRDKGLLSLRSGLALLVVVVLAHQLCRFRSDRRLDTRDWTLTDFIQRLHKSGLQLQVVPAVRHGALSEGEGVYLTEDAAATWDAMQHKRRVVEYIHQWHGTVWLGRA